MIAMIMTDAAPAMTNVSFERLPELLTANEGLLVGDVAADAGPTPKAVCAMMQSMNLSLQMLQLLCTALRLVVSMW